MIHSLYRLSTAPWCGIGSRQQSSSCSAHIARAAAEGRTGETSLSACQGVDRSSEIDRRQLLAAALAVVAGGGLVASPAAAAATAAPSAEAVQALQAAALAAYATRDFAQAVQRLNDIIDIDPQEVKWREMRAQALVDGKNFYAAITDFDWALEHIPQDAAVDRARLLSGRGLAFEGQGDWVAALADYDASLELAQGAGLLPDPYILNSRGNCHASLGEWSKARESYLASSEGFQRASGFRYGRSTTPRLDGAIFAASNAALMLVQMGDEKAAMREMQNVARRAPGSVDMRAALAALYWKNGDEAAAEASWNFACENISEGCRKFEDPDFVSRIRRWPPVMCAYLKDFLALRSSSSAAAQQK